MKIEDILEALPSKQDILAALPSKEDIASAIGVEARSSTTGDMLTALSIFGTGMILGAGLALLFAPKPGHEIRHEPDVQTSVNAGPPAPDAWVAAAGFTTMDAARSASMGISVEAGCSSSG